MTRMRLLTVINLSVSARPDRGHSDVEDIISERQQAVASYHRIYLSVGREG